MQSKTIVIQITKTPIDKIGELIDSYKGELLSVDNGLAFIKVKEKITPGRKKYA